MSDNIGSTKLTVGIRACRFEELGVLGGLAYTFGIFTGAAVFGTLEFGACALTDICMRREEPLTTDGSRSIIPRNQ